MRETPQLDLACFSYLAAARIVRVDHYPEPNHGSEINSVDESVNGDGPLVAAFASGLGLTTALEANAVADKPAHSAVRSADETVMGAAVAGAPTSRSRAASPSSVRPALSASSGSGGAAKAARSGATARPQGS
jgi:hypothetical protein